MIDWTSTAMFYAVIIAKIAMFVAIGKLLGWITMPVLRKITPIDRSVPWYKQVPSYAVACALGLIGIMYAGSAIWLIYLPWGTMVCASRFGCP